MCMQGLVGRWIQLLLKLLQTDMLEVNETNNNSICHWRCKGGGGLESKKPS
jgi:hypothetical protein